MELIAFKIWGKQISLNRILQVGTEWLAYKEDFNLQLVHYLQGIVRIGQVWWVLSLEKYEEFYYVFMFSHLNAFFNLKAKKEA